MNNKNLMGASQQIGMPHIAQSNYQSMQNISTAVLDPSAAAYVPFKEKYTSSKFHFEFTQPRVF